jgi:hypothetical protein
MENSTVHARATLRLPILVHHRAWSAKVVANSICFVLKPAKTKSRGVGSGRPERANVSPGAVGTRLKRPESLAGLWWSLRRAPNEIVAEGQQSSFKLLRDNLQASEQLYVARSPANTRLGDTKSPYSAPCIWPRFGQVPVARSPHRSYKLGTPAVVSNASRG